MVQTNGLLSMPRYTGMGGSSTALTLSVMMTGLGLLPLSPAIASQATALPPSFDAAATARPLFAEGPAEESPILAQTTVQGLSDVQPTDWAFQAVQSLNQQYGCLIGYPDGTFRGDQALTRYEFAAALNACLDSLTAVFTGNGADAQTLETVQQLQQDFSAELALLEAQVTDLEARTAELEANTFSTTTKLRGEVVFSVEQLMGDDQPNGSGEPLPQSLTLGSRARFSFDTSFTGQDLLRIRLDALNPAVLNARATGTNMTRLAFDRSNQNSFDIGSFFYRFPVGDQLQLQIDGARGTYAANIVSTFNPGLSAPLNGAVSRFGRFNPIYYQGSPGMGVTGTYDFSDSLSLSLSYYANDGSASNPDIGAFGGGYTALAQLDVRPTENWNVGLTYARSFYPMGGVAVSAGTGSRLANAPFGNIATSADHLGLQSTVRVAKGVNLSGWAGLSFAHAEATSASATLGDSATLFNWAMTLGFPDLGGPGNLGGVIVGQPPRVTSNTGGAVDGAAAWHLETFYRYQVNKNISLIPGFFVVLNPEHNSANDPIWLLSFRTMFQF